MPRLMFAVLERIRHQLVQHHPAIRSHQRSCDGEQLVHFGVADRELQSLSEGDCLFRIGHQELHFGRGENVALCGSPHEIRRGLTSNLGVPAVLPKGARGLFEIVLEQLSATIRLTCPSLCGPQLSTFSRTRSTTTWSRSSSVWDSDTGTVGKTRPGSC